MRGSLTELMERNPKSPLEETTSKIRENVTELKAEYEKVNERIAKESKKLKNATNEVREKSIKKQIMMLLRRKKNIEKQLTFFGEQLFNIDQLSYGAENSEELNDTNKQPVTKRELITFSFEDDDDSKYDIKNMVEQLNEVNDILSGLQKPPEEDEDIKSCYRNLDNEISKNHVSLQGLLTQIDQS